MVSSADLGYGSAIATHEPPPRPTAARRRRRQHPEPPASRRPRARAAPGTRAERPAKRTRTSGAWTGVIAGAIILLLLLIFILENTQRVKISFLGIHGHLSLGVALLLAAVGGGLVVGIVAIARIVQLRTRARRLSHQLPA